jgi:hypothetical protein
MTAVRSYRYVSETSAPMTGFVGAVRRAPPRFADNLDRLAELFGVGKGPERFSPPSQLAVASTVSDVADADPGIFHLPAPEYVDLGGKGKPRLTKKQAILHLANGATRQDLQRDFHIPKSLGRSLPALIAHQTMGTYSGKPREKVNRARATDSTGGLIKSRALELLDAGQTPKQVASAHPGSNVWVIRGWAAGRTREVRRKQTGVMKGDVL